MPSASHLLAVMTDDVGKPDAARQGFSLRELAQSDLRSCQSRVYRPLMNLALLRTQADFGHASLTSGSSHNACAPRHHAT